MVQNDVQKEFCSILESFVISLVEIKIMKSGLRLKQFNNNCIWRGHWPTEVIGVG